MSGSRRVVGSGTASLVFTPPPPPPEFVDDFHFEGDNYSGIFLGSVYLTGPQTGVTPIARADWTWDVEHDRGEPAGFAFGGWQIAWDGDITYEVVVGASRTGTLTATRTDSADADSSYNVLVDLTDIELQAGEVVKLTAEPPGSYVMNAIWLT